MNSEQTHTHYSFNMHFNVVEPSTSRSSN